MYSEQLVEDTKRILKDKHMEFEFKEEIGVYAVDIILKTMNIRGCIFIAISEKDVNVLVQTALIANDGNKSRVAEFLRLVNRNDTRGNFEFDKAQGTIRYRCRLDINDIHPTREMLQKTIFMAEAVYHQYAPALFEVMAGTVPPEAAWKSAVREDKNLEKTDCEKLPDNRCIRTISPKKTTPNVFQKVPLGIPAGFQVAWNTFYDIRLEAAREHADKCHKYFTEDMLLLKKTDGSKSLDLGWDPDLDLSGKYLLSHSNREEAYYEFQSEDILAVIDSIHETLSIWKDDNEPEADKLVPLRIAAGWEIQYNRWIKTGRFFADSLKDDVKEQLLFRAVKHNVGCIKIHYRDQQVPIYELSFQADAEDKIKIMEFQEEEKAVAVLEDWLEHAHMGIACLG